MRRRKVAVAAMLGTVAVATTVAVAPAPAGAPPPLFATSDQCLACHNGMTTPSGEDVSIGFAWRGSMMANSARDPYWQAAVRRETVDYPAAASVIQNECAACHMPMARFQAHVAGRELEVFSRLGGGVRRGGPAVATRSRWTGCRARSATSFRTAVRGWSTTANSRSTPPARGASVSCSARTTSRRPGRASCIRRRGFSRRARPTWNSRRSARPATRCIRRRSAGAPGDKPAARFPEQVPYLEWRASAYVREKSCQACHMTFTAEPTPAASVLGEPRERFARHGFQGANFFMLAMLERYRGELGVVALPQELSLSRQRTLELLRTSAASLSIARAEIRDGRLEAEVVVTNTAGHKLPTAYPSRRAWLRFVVSDGGGRRLWASGALRPDGSIEGNDNDRDPLAFEPHHRVIETPDQVQIYESIMLDARGRVTTGLLSAVRYVKDNRLLPRGFDKAAAGDDYAVGGDAKDDPDFQGGGDRVVFRPRLPPGAVGPFRIDVELLYQPIAFRWAHNLDAYRAAPEPARFVRYYEAMSTGSATTLASGSRCR